MTPHQQDRVVDGCCHCERCLVDCPYGPDRHPLAVDVPRAVRRSLSMRWSTGQQPLRFRLTTGVVGRPARFAAVARVGGRPGSRRRRVLAKAIGFSARRSLPAVASQRFSVWFRSRSSAPRLEPRERVTLLPTCLVERHAVDIGRDLVEVLEAHGVRCEIATVDCCGGPWLQAGDLRRFRRVAGRNVVVLANAIRSGSSSVVVPDPDCALTVRREYPTHVDPGHRDDADLVAAHVRLASDETVSRAAAVGGSPSIATSATVVELVTGTAQRLASDGALGALLERSGIAVRTVIGSAGGRWALRASNDEAADALADRVAGRVIADPEVAIVLAECVLDAAALSDRCHRPVVHPVSVLARRDENAPG